MAELELKPGITRGIDVTNEKQLTQIADIFGPGYAENYAKEVLAKTNKVIHYLNQRPDGMLVLKTIDA